MTSRILIGSVLYMCLGHAFAAAPHSPPAAAASSTVVHSSSPTTTPTAPPPRPVKPVTTPAAESPAPVTPPPATSEPAAVVPPAPVVVAPAVAVAPAVVVGGAANCSAIAFDSGLMLMSWEAGSPSLATAEAVATKWCNTGSADPMEYDPVPGANCTIAQSWCSADLCSAVAVYQPLADSAVGEIIALSSKPSSMSAAMADALARCTEAACANGADCSKGAPHCYIQTVVCNTDGFEYTHDEFSFFNKKAMPADAYIWLYANKTVTGTVANLHY